MLLRPRARLPIGLLCPSSTATTLRGSVNSCLVLGVETQGRSVTTVEGLAGDELHPLQQQFLENAALQCGVCTPGFLVASKALLEKNPNPTEHDVRFFLAGNLCRCTGYDKIVKAVLAAAEDMRAQA